jgi:hypothetical protein
MMDRMMRCWLARSLAVASAVPKYPNRNVYLRQGARIIKQLQGLVVPLFMPVFFSLAGLNADLSILKGSATRWPHQPDCDCG